MKSATAQKTRASRKRVVGFNILEDRCIWMKAGVVSYRICDNAFDCNTCAFNKAIQQAMQRKPESGGPSDTPRWVSHLLARYDGANLPCRHALTGRIGAPKICPHNYECHHCEFDQMLDEMDLMADVKTPACREVAGFKIAESYYYHLGHSWIRFEHGGRARIGLDDFAACVFRGLDRIDLPPLGAEVAQDQVGWIIGRQDQGAAVLSPVSGVVLAVNHSALAHPHLVDADPYGSGWLLMVEPEAPKRNLKKLFYGRETVQWIDRETHELLDYLGPPYQRMAATGGTVDRTFFDCIAVSQWSSLAFRFLHTTCRA